MADSSTSPGHATRTVETTRGLLTYAQLAPLLAERVLVVEQQIAARDFQSRTLDGEFTRQLHAAIAGDLVPAWAGNWRAVPVQVGAHEPPAPHEIPVLMRVYGDDLAARLAHLTDDLLLEALAFAEGRFLSIHPFRDFNGRVTRLPANGRLVPPIPVLGRAAAIADVATLATDQRLFISLLTPVLGVINTTYSEPTPPVATTANVVPAVPAVQPVAAPAPAPAK